MQAARLVVLSDPEGISGKEEFRLPAGTLLMDWLIGKYGADGFNVPTTVFSGGLTEQHIIDLNNHCDDGLPVIADELITIVHRPQGTNLALALLHSVVASLVVSSLVPEVEIPEFETPTESSNNSLTGQTNIARPLQRIPDLFGKNKVYPDLITRTYFEFIGNVKYQTEYLCVGRGEFLLEDPRSGDTPIPNISGASFVQFEPFTRPAQLLNVLESNEVNGQQIFGPGEPVFEAENADVQFFESNLIVSTDIKMNELSKALPGDAFTIAGAVSTGSSVVGSSDIDFAGSTITSTSVDLDGFSSGDILVITATASNNVTVEMASGDIDTITCIDPITGDPISFVTESGTSAAITSAFDNDGTFTLDTFSITVVPDGDDIYQITTVENTIDTTPPLFNADFISVLDKPSTVGPFVVPSLPEQAWVDIAFPRGLSTDNNNAYEVKFKFHLQKLDSNGDPDGAVSTTQDTFIGDQTSTLTFTHKIIPASPGSAYEMSIERLTLNTSQFNQSKWARLAGVENFTQSHFGNVTTVLVTTIATEQATSIQRREFNAISTRKLVTYDRVNDTMTSNTAATARMADAAVNILTDPFMGNKPLSQIDLEALYDIQDRLDADAVYGDLLGRFCYSFSNDKTPVGDELKTCLNAARCFAYREGDIVRFARDEIQPTRKTIFNRRNKKPSSSKRNTVFSKPSDNNAIEINWQGEDTGTGNTIKFPEDGSGTVFKKIDAAGIKNYDQAWNRGFFEFLKLKHERTTLELVSTNEGYLVDLNDRVGNVDGINIDDQAGEVVATSGFQNLTIHTSERIDFKGSPNSTVILRNDDGSVSDAIACVPIIGDERGFVLSISPNFTVFIRGTNGYQVGTIYNFGHDSNQNAKDFKVLDIQPVDDGYVRLKLINYAPEIYAPDLLPAVVNYSKTEYSEEYS
ncbi:hypothetical protein KAR91_72845 [Candidatus Pacearchaeota archaeon]|nr:hypothetical protein [Candidatus Pacearchaeota archaeon]